ncbi:MAG: hypothetical protein ACTHQQ_09190 [Solirubrobacteraceae bacterium]
MIARMFRPAFTVRRSFLVLGILIGGLAFPAVSEAALYTVNTNSVPRNQGFSLHLHAFNTNPGYGGPNQTSVSAFLIRTRGHVTQTDQYTFNKGVKLTGSRNLSTGHITGTLQDARGSINLTFHGTGPTRRAPGGCGGAAGKKRSGKLIGSMTLKADKLGTVKLHAIRATFSTATSLCHPGFPKGFFLEGFRGTGTSYYVNAGKPSPTGVSRELISVTRNGGTVRGGGLAWSFLYSYKAEREPTSMYTVGKSLASATVKGASGIHGTASYTGKSNAHHSTGHLSGNLSVNMATIGLVKPFASGRMTADQRHS